MSPPAASAASSAASRRSARSPPVRANAACIAGHTAVFSIMFACTENPAPAACPAAAMQRAPVWVATRPCASTIATCRTSA